VKIRRPNRDARPDSGFTMIEIIVVILIIGLTMRIVFANMGAWIPETALDAEAAKLRSWIDRLRSEARVQGKPYSIELDLEENRTRLVLPPEDKLVTTEDDTLAATIPQAWSKLDDSVVFHGHAIAGREVRTTGKILITFSESGFTADQSVFFKHIDEDSRMVWTVHIHGLSGSTRVVTDVENNRAIFNATEESDF